MILPINPGSVRFISSWGFADEYVKRLLLTDILDRQRGNQIRMWVFQNERGQTVGFGTLDLCADWSYLCDGKRHPYVPLLAVHPGFQRRGIGSKIVNHLINEATLALVDQPSLHRSLLLDVYSDNVGGIGLYQKSGFQFIGNPHIDPQENNKEFRIMATQLADPFAGLFEDKI